jgi:citrate lyase subunit beta/citryl-CoA lyase
MAGESDLVRSNRSFLYVPADRIDRVPKAVGSGADAVLVDLEDAVAPSARPGAREALPSALSEFRLGSVQLWIRINPGAEGELDLVAVRRLGSVVDGVLAAKCESVAWLDTITASVSDDVAIAALIESARAVRAIDAIASHPRLVLCHLGEIDLLADLAATGAGGRDLIRYARHELVIASAAAGLLAPIGGVEPAIRDQAALAHGCQELVDLGFSGRPAIHPSQVPAINQAFTPTAEAVADAARLVAEYDEAVALGLGAITGSDGTMLDEAVVRRARAVLGNARRDQTPAFEP